MVNSSYADYTLKPDNDRYHPMYIKCSDWLLWLQPSRLPHPWLIGGFLTEAEALPGIALWVKVIHGRYTIVLIKEWSKQYLNYASLIEVYL